MHIKKIYKFISFIGVALFLLQTQSFAQGNLRQTPVVKVVQDNAAAVVNISTERIILLRENPYWGSYGNELDCFFGQWGGGISLHVP